MLRGGGRKGGEQERRTLDLMFRVRFYIYKNCHLVYHIHTTCHINFEKKYIYIYKQNHVLF